MARYSTYWRWIPVRMIQEYKRIQKDDSPQAKIFTEAINRALNETEQLPTGKLRIRAVKLVYINKTHTLEGAAQKLYVSKITIQRYIQDFIDLVAKYSGYTK